MRKLTLAIAASTLSIPAGIAVTAAPAAAAPIFSNVLQDSQVNEQRNRNYDRYGNYRGRTWRGRDGRYRCTRSDGTIGILVGGAGGAAIGSAVAGRGNRTEGAIIGGIIGAIAGRQVDRADSGYRDSNGRRCR